MLSAQPAIVVKTLGSVTNIVYCQTHSTERDTAAAAAAAVLLSEKMNLDEISVLLGEFGPYQKCKYFLICLFSTLSALHAINMVFVGAEPLFNCNLPRTNASITLRQNVTYKDTFDLFIPTGEKCHHYNMTERVIQLKKLDYNVSAVLMLHNNVSQVACTAGYNYSKEQYVTTITSDVSSSHNFLYLFI